MISRKTDIITWNDLPNYRGELFKVERGRRHGDFAVGSRDRQKSIMTMNGFEITELALVPCLPTGQKLSRNEAIPKIENPRVRIHKYRSCGTTLLEAAIERGCGDIGFREV